MAPSEFKHFGVPTTAPQENETYIEGAKVFVTDPDVHPYKVEFLRFESDSPMPEAVQTQAHAAFMVDDLDAALSGREIIVEPFDANETLRVAFFLDGDAVIELMESK
jgi:hypothetical protein